jgi:hypothetical protein
MAGMGPMAGLGAMGGMAGMGATPPREQNIAMVQTLATKAGE